MQSATVKRRRRAKQKSPVANTRRRARKKKSKRNNVGTHVRFPSSNSGQASAASAYATGQETRPPRIVSSSDQVRIKHRELVTSLSGTAAFTVAATFPLNPGLPTTFPWLASQAQAWERYRFNSLKFQYYTRTGTLTPGSVLLAPDYDAADAAPLTEVIASSYEDVAEDAPWKDITCTLRPSALHALGPTKFIRTANLAANLDIKTYDAGNFFACTTDGGPGSWGKLWVEYDVTLFTPQTNPSGYSLSQAQHIVGATPTSTAMLGVAPVIQPGSSNLVTVVNETVTFQSAGKFLVNLVTAASTSVTQTSGATLVGGTYSDLGGSPSPCFAGSGTTALIDTMIVNATIGTTLVFNNTIVGGLVADLMISRLPPDLQ